MTATATKTSLERWIRAASNLIALIPSRSNRKIFATFVELNSKRLYRSSGKAKESRCLVLTFSTKLNNRK